MNKKKQQGQEVLHQTTLDLQDVISLLNRDNHRSLQWTGTNSCCG